MTVKTRTEPHRNAIEVLKEHPFDFIEFGKYRDVLPREFKIPAEGCPHWADATAVLAVIRSKPSTWQWQNARIQRQGGLTDRQVRRGVAILKRLGWLQTIIVYNEDRRAIGNFILSFEKPIPEHQREGRFTMILTESGWMVRPPGEGYRPAKKKENQHHEPPSQERDLSVQGAYGHYSSISRPQTPKGVEPFDSSEDDVETEPEVKTEQEDPPKAENRQAHDLARRLEQLGKVREDSDEDALAYEEFISHTLLPELEMPPGPEGNRGRRKIWNLRWAEDNLLGAILLRMSSSERWTVQTARRLIRRANEGYINREDLKIILFTFDWTRARSDRPTLEQMTYYRKEKDGQTGEVRIVDAWAKSVRMAKNDYKWAWKLQLMASRNRLFPGNEAEWHLSCDEARYVANEIWEICTGRRDCSDFQLRGAVYEPENLAFILSRHGRTEEDQRKVEEAHDELVEYFATNHTGVQIFKKNYHVLEETTGCKVDEVREVHRHQVDVINRRLICHGLSTAGLDRSI